MTLGAWLGVLIPVAASLLIAWLRFRDKETSRKLGRSEAKNEGREGIDNLRRRLNDTDKLREPKPDD